MKGWMWESEKLEKKKTIEMWEREKKIREERVVWGGGEREREREREKK
jgi:hypothetical protein